MEKLNFVKENVETSTLVISGGLFGGLLEVGSIRALERFSLNPRLFSSICGISVGSILSFFIAIGLSSESIIVISEKLCDIVCLSSEKVEVSSIVKFISSSSIIPHSRVLNCISELLQKHKSNMFHCTFEQLFAKTKINLVVVATRSDGEETFFSFEKTPQVKCIDAVLASISIPFLFPHYKIGKYYYYDGCFSNPCPLFDFVSSSSIVYLRIINSPKMMKEEHPSFFDVLQIFIKSTDRLENIRFTNDSSLISKNGGNLFTINLEYDPPSLLSKISEEEKRILIMKGFEQTINQISK